MIYFLKYLIIEKMQYNDFGKFLRKKRESLVPKVSLNSFAINNDIDSATLSKIERQQQGISLDVISKVANGYGVLISKLFEEYETSFKTVK